MTSGSALPSALAAMTTDAKNPAVTSDNAANLLGCFGLMESFPGVVSTTHLRREAVRDLET
jgi:hypothetical protein